MQPTLEDAILLAREAGDILRDSFGRTHQIGYKGPMDLVTEVDHRSDRFLIDTIQHRFAGDAIITEESGELSGVSKNCWYIDPLDGTINYAHGIPFFCVSLAYADDDGLRLGVVYDPIMDECYAAERGHGAYLNNEPARVSTISDLEHSLLITGFPYSLLATPHNNFENFIRLSHLTQGVRRMGSAALDICYVACGRVEGFWEFKLNAWDIAAGILIAQEAGAITTDVQGSPDFMRKPYSILVANPKIHPFILEILQETQKQ